MHHFKAIGVAAAFLASSAVAAPHLEVRQNGRTCQTSDASPDTEDLTAVINELNGRGGSCPQTNGVASSKSTGGANMHAVYTH